MTDPVGGARGAAGVRVFGLNVETDFPFETPLPPKAGPADLVFTCERRDPEEAMEPGSPPLFESPIQLDDGAPLFTLHRMDDGDLLRFTEVADFLVSDDAIRCQLLDPAYGYMVEIHLLGIVLAYWFERKGTPMLHASAVSVEGRAVGFLATNQGGKSSLAGTLMQMGHPLLTDDLLGIRPAGNGFVATPGFPSMRLWPDQAQHFLGHWEDLPLAHPRFPKRRIPVGEGGFGRFVDAPRPLAALYLPLRRGAAPGDPLVTVEALRPGEAVIELARGSFLPRMTQLGGRAAERLSLFARLVSAVPVRRFIYTEGVDLLPEVCRALLRDLEDQTASSGGSRP